MSFGSWPVLLGLFVPLAIGIWVWRRSNRRVVLPLDHGRQSRGRVWHFLLGATYTVPPLLLTVAVLLLAGPRHLDVPREQRVLTNIEFCLDLSGSMLARFGEHTRYDAAMEAINMFVDHREGDAFGLTLFADRALPWIPLTQDPSAFKYATPFVHPRNMFQSLGGGTMIGRALRTCRDNLVQREEGDRMILLVSDGESFDLRDGDDEVLARELRDENIVMYAVHIGDGMIPANVASICTITGGSSFSPGDDMALREVFQRIDQMQTARLERTFADEMDFYWPFCLAGLGLLMIAIISSFGLRYTPW